MMAIRPIDIARHFGISTTTIRVYEEMHLIPKTLRSETGYRIYTDEHIAYFSCVREMLAGFSLTQIAKILKLLMEKDIDAALWIVNKTQADLHQEKAISEKMMQRLYQNNNFPDNRDKKVFTINDMSKETGVPATTIRYWDKVGLISAKRQNSNNYRIFTSEHIKKIHVIYAIKFALFSTNHKYSVSLIKQQMSNLNYDDESRIEKIAQDFYHYLDVINRNQIKSVAALYHLCKQVENDYFEPIMKAR
jgi:DNA-binding transcriptional MerR regulator